MVDRHRQPQRIRQPPLQRHRIRIRSGFSRRLAPLRRLSRCWLSASASRTDSPPPTICRASAAGSSAVISVRAWPAVSSPLRHHVAHVFGQAQQAQRIGDMRAALADHLRQVLLRIVELLDQLAIAHAPLRAD